MNLAEILVQDPSLFTNFPTSFLPSLSIAPSAYYTYQDLGESARFLYFLTRAESDVGSPERGVVASGPTLALSSDGILSGEIETLSFLSGDGAEIAVLEGLSLPARTLTEIIIARAVFGDTGAPSDFKSFLLSAFDGSPSITLSKEDEVWGGGRDLDSALGAGHGRRR